MEKFDPFQFSYHSEIPKEEKDNYKKVENGFVQNDAFEKQQEAKKQARRSFTEWISGAEKKSFMDSLHQEAIMDDEIYEKRKRVQIENPNFLKIKYNLHISPEVESAAKKTEVQTGEKFSQNSLDRIQNYLNRLKGVFEIKDEEKRDRIITKIKDIIHEKFVIKENEIPESYFQNQLQIAHEQGHGEIEMTNDRKKELAEVVISDQESSLNNWIDYLSSEDAAYPDWLKYWAFRSVLGMGKYDKEKGQFVRRDLKNTIAPFPDINHEALAYVLDAIQKKTQKEDINFDLLSEEEREEFGKLLQSENFAKLYAFAIKKITPASKEQIMITMGKWVKYTKGSDHIPLVESLQGHGTGWCTAGESTAKAQLQNGDFHVYYSNDENGNARIPRAAIRMQKDRIAEIRGIAEKQNLDPYISDVVNEKLAEFPDGKLYEKKTSDMKLLTEIEKKVNNDQDLNKKELEFLYEMKSNIEGFGNQKDPRIEKIINERDSKKDAMIIFDCRQEQFAENIDEINENTRLYIGLWNEEVFRVIKGHPNARNIYESFPRKKIYMVDLDNEPEILNSANLVQKSLDEKDVYISPTASNILKRVEFSKEKQTYRLVGFTITQLGLSFGTTVEEFYKKAQDIGLELCEEEVGPLLRLQLKDKMNSHVQIAMKQLFDGQQSYIFHLSDRGSKSRLDCSPNSPFDLCYLNTQFMFHYHN